MPKAPVFLGHRFTNHGCCSSDFSKRCCLALERRCLALERRFLFLRILGPHQDVQDSSKVCWKRAPSNGKFNFQLDLKLVRSSLPRKSCELWIRVSPAFCCQTSGNAVVKRTWNLVCNHRNTLNCRKNSGLKGNLSSLAGDMNRLRSSVWSSETLLEGHKSLERQPDGFLVKTEEDEELVTSYRVTLLLSHLRWEPLGVESSSVLFKKGFVTTARKNVWFAIVHLISCKSLLTWSPGNPGNPSDIWNKQDSFACSFWSVLMKQVSGLLGKQWVCKYLPPSHPPKKKGRCKLCWIAGS